MLLMKGIAYLSKSKNKVFLEYIILRQNKFQIENNLFLSHIENFANKKKTLEKLSINYILFFSEHIIPNFLLHFIHTL